MGLETPIGTVSDSAALSAVADYESGSCETG
jgi:hypothetical protein